MHHDHTTSRKVGSKFVARVILIMAIGWSAVTILNVVENVGRIDDLQEGTARLIVWGILLLWLNHLSYKSLTTPLLRSVIPISSIFLLIKLVVDVTRDIKALDDVAIVGRNSPFSLVLPPVSFAAAIIATFMVLYLIVRWYDEVYNEVDLLSTRMASVFDTDPLDAMVSSIGELTGCSAVVLSELRDNATELTVRSHWYRESGVDVSHLKATTPIDLNVVEHYFFQQSDICQTCPLDERLAELNAVGYLALPLVSVGSPIGFIEIIHDQPLSEELPQRLLCRVAQAQATAELARIRAERTRRSADELMARSEHLVSIGRMAAGIAHEVNNPLCIISMHTELARMALKQEVREGVLDSLSAVDTSVERAGRVVASVLKSAREDPVDKWDADLSTIVKQVRDIMRDRAKERAIQIHFEAPHDVPTLRINPTAIEQLLLNLVTNAVDASPDGGSVTLAVDCQDNGLQVSVTDHGEGIEQDAVRHVFDPFFTTKKGGTGLGLSIVHRIASDHEATLSIDTSKGQGTTVRIRFPYSHHEQFAEN